MAALGLRLEVIGRPPMIVGDGEMRRRRLWRWSFSAASVVFLIVLLYLAWGRLQPERVLGALGRSDWRLLVLAVLCKLPDNGFRNLCWFVLFKGVPHSTKPIGYWNLTWLNCAVQALNNLLPARAGEALRILQLSRRYGYTAGTIFAVHVVQKYVEVLSLALIALAVVLLMPVPPVLRFPLLALFMLGVLGGPLLLLLAMGRGDATVPTAIAIGEPSVVPLLRGAALRFADALHTLKAPGIVVASVLHSLLGDLAHCTAIGLCLLALGIRVDAGSWLLLYLTVSLVLAVPSTPGQLGMMEAGLVLMLQALAVDTNQALAAALLIHAVDMFPALLLGLLGVYLEPTLHRAAVPRP